MRTQHENDEKSKEVMELTSKISEYQEVIIKKDELVSQLQNQMQVLLNNE